MLRFETAGESHGECLVATLTGLPSGVPISLERVNRELWRRQQGFGRGGRMKIEGGCVALPKGAGLGVELDRVALAKAAENYRRCGFTERNDEPEMQKKVPGWKFKATRW
jgi:hypothetical protein